MKTSGWSQCYLDAASMGASALFMEAGLKPLIGGGGGADGGDDGGAGARWVQKMAVIVNFGATIVNVGASMRP
eukprot:SAG25_NODE_347_length_9358_cov_86.358315_6_plen_73_part_00